MEINLKITLGLNKSLIESLGITDDTAFITTYHDGKLVIEVLDDDGFIEDDLYDEDEDYDEDEEFDCEPGCIDCKDCEYFCNHCKRCVLD